MLYTLDPHSVLLDVDSYKDMRTTTQGKFGGLGIVIEMDRKGRILVKKPMPDTRPCAPGSGPRTTSFASNSESTINMDATRGSGSAARRGGRSGGRVRRAGRCADAEEVHHCARLHPHPPAIDPPRAC